MLRRFTQALNALSPRSDFIVSHGVNGVNIEREKRHLYSGPGRTFESVADMFGTPNGLCSSASRSGYIGQLLCPYTCLALNSLDKNLYYL